MNRLTKAAAAFAFLAPLVVAGTAFAGPDAATLTFDFQTGASTGAIMVALYDSQAAYDDGGAPVAQRRLDVAAGETRAAFEGLPAGDYAMKAFHDVDGNGRMNTNPFGMPSEPYAFSNNARGNMGPARWDRAHVTVAAPVEQAIDIR